MQQRPVVTLLRPHRERQKEREAAQRHGRDPRGRLPRARSHHRRRDDVNKRGGRNPQLRHPAPASAFARVQQLGAPEVRAGVREFDGAGVERPVGVQFLEDQAAKFRELPFGGEGGAGNREGVRARERDQKRLRLGEAGQFGPGLRDQAAIAAQRQRFRIGLQHPRVAAMDAVISGQQFLFAPGVLTPLGTPVQPIRARAEQQARCDRSERCGGRALPLAQLLRHHSQPRSDQEQADQAHRHRQAHGANAPVQGRLERAEFVQRDSVRNFHGRLL